MKVDDNQMHKGKWLGYVWREGPLSQVRKLQEGKENRKRRGIPKVRWLEEVKKDLSSIGITRWSAKTSNKSNNISINQD